jgi:hypothetical protein
MTEPSEETTAVETVDVQTEAVSTPAGAEPARTDLGKVRELVLKAHPDVVPDLVAGSSVDELIASVEPARTAYQRIADQVRGREPQVTGDHATETETARRLQADGRTASTEGSTTVVVQPPVVPAGGASNAVDPGDLTPTSKIAQALATRRKK